VHDLLEPPLLRKDFAVTDALPRIPVVRSCPFGPPAEYTALRDAGPVTEVELPGGKTAWAVTTLAAVREVLARTDLSSDPRRPNFPDPFPEAGDDPDDDDDEDEPTSLLIEMDPPRHTTYRRMLIPELTVRRVAELRPGIQALADRLIDDLLANGPEADLVTAYSLAIPSSVICQLLGIPEGHHEFFQTRTETALSRTTSGQEKMAAYGEIYAFLDEVVTAKEVEPTDDILGRLITKYVRTGEMPRKVLVSTAVLLLLAGHETSANTIALRPNSGEWSLPSSPITAGAGHPDGRRAAQSRDGNR
jgi:cytochrome P450